jgi:hypothetical protein
VADGAEGVHPASAAVVSRPQKGALIGVVVNVMAGQAGDFPLQDSFPERNPEGGSVHLLRDGDVHRMQVGAGVAVKAEPYGVVAGLQDAAGGGLSISGVAGFTFLFVGIRYPRVNVNGRKEHPSLELEVETPGIVPAPAGSGGSAHEKEDEVEQDSGVFHCSSTPSHADLLSLPMVTLSRDLGISFENPWKFNT